MTDLLLQQPHKEVGMELMVNHNKHKDIRLLDKLKQGG